MTDSQRQTTSLSYFRRIKMIFLLDYLQSNHMAAQFADDEESMLYIQLPEKQYAHFPEAIVALMEAINFIVILYGKPDQLEGCFYSPSEGFYAGLPPIHFTSSPKIEEKVSDDS